MAWIAGNKDPDGGAVSQTADKVNAYGAGLGLALTSGSTPKVYVVTGVPSNSIGANGDYAFRLDGTGGATRFYQKAAGSWAAVTQVN